MSLQELRLHDDNWQVMISKSSIIVTATNGFTIQTRYFENSLRFTAAEVLLRSSDFGRFSLNVLRMGVFNSSLNSRELATNNNNL